MKGSMELDIMRMKIMDQRRVSAKRGKVRLRYSVLILVGLGVLGAGWLWADGGSYVLNWFAMDSGGENLSGGAYTLRGTLGQPEASGGGLLTGDGYTVEGGFWSASDSRMTVYLPLIRK